MPSARNRMRLVILVAGTLFVLALVIWRIFPRSPEPYWSKAEDAISALRSGSFQNFEQSMVPLSYAKLGRKNLERVFHSYLSPQFKKGTLRLNRALETREVGTGSVVYWLKLPGYKDELQIGLTAEFDGVRSLCKLEDVVKQAMMINAYTDGNPQSQGSDRVRKYYPILRGLGMNGVERVQEDNTAVFYPWEEYIKRWEAMEEFDRKQAGSSTR